MSSQDEHVIKFRVTYAFKMNTRKLVERLYSCGLRDDAHLSNYIREAVKEKRRRDVELLERHDNALK